MNRTSRLGHLVAVAAIAALAGCSKSSTPGADGGTGTTGSSSANNGSTGSAVNGGSSGAAASSGSSSSGSSSSGTSGSAGSSSGGGSTGAAGSAGSTSSGGTTGVSETQAASDYANAECNLISSCSNGWDISLTYGDLANCVALFEQYTANRFAQPAPPSGLTAANAEACAQALPTQTCVAQSADDLVPACGPATGTGAIGDPCSIDAECASQFCALGNNTVCATCQPPPDAGSDCSAEVCGEGLVCLHGLNSCSAPVPDGGACETDEDCVYGFACTSGDGGTHVCVPGEALNQPCVDLVGPLCLYRDGLYCKKQGDGGSLCTQLGLADAGQACGTVSGLVTDCAYSGFCTGGLCVPAAADGDACDTANGPNCLPESKCVITTGTSGICTAEASSACGVVSTGGGSTGGTSGGGTSGGTSGGGTSGGRITYLVDNDGQTPPPVGATGPSLPVFEAWLNGATVSFSLYEEPSNASDLTDPILATLTPFDTLIWFTGANDVSNETYTISSTQEPALTQWRGQFLSGHGAWAR